MEYERTRHPTVVDFLHRDESERRVDDFTRLVESKTHLQFAVRQVRTLKDLTALSRRIGAPLREMDVVLNYRDMNERWWPWFDHPMQARRHFVHAGEMPQPGEIEGSAGTAGN